MVNPAVLDYWLIMIEAIDRVDLAVSEELVDGYHRDGFMVIPALYAPGEIAAIRNRFDALAAAGQPVDTYWVPDLSPEAAGDPLKRYPRVMQPHRWDESIRQYLLHPRVYAVLRILLGEEPIAAQSMFYYKPPGARGQALHQDNFYLQVKPGSCIATWTAIDPAQPENGGLYVVPGTQDLAIVCPERANEKESFVTHLVRPPAGKKAIPMRLASGDTLFFNGSLIHGSPPNRSQTQWRRSFICHYIPASATHISKWYAPLLNFDGSVVEFQPSTDGGPCGKEFQGGNYGSYGKDVDNSQFGA